jgi:DNA polymerase III delta prime subunit
MISQVSNSPLSELLRPETFQQLALPGKYISGMQAMFDAGRPDNMLLFGAPGTGKSSAARIFVKARGDYDHLTVDGSVDNGIDYVRKVIGGFASTYPFTPGLKIVFIDDGDFLSKEAQASLRGLIERSSATCRFIVAVNDVTKVDPAIRSRLLCLHFAIPRAEAASIAKRLQVNVSERLIKLGWSFDRERLNQIVTENLSDLRAMANKLQFEFRQPTIETQKAQPLDKPSSPQALSG